MRLLIKANELDVVLTKNHGKVTILEVYDQEKEYYVEGPEIPDSIDLNLFVIPFDEVVEITYKAK